MPTGPPLALPVALCNLWPFAPEFPVYLPLLDEGEQCTVGMSRHRLGSIGGRDCDDAFGSAGDGKGKATLEPKGLFPPGLRTGELGIDAGGDQLESVVVGI